MADPPILRLTKGDFLSPHVESQRQWIKGCGEKLHEERIRNFKKKGKCHGKKEIGKK
jgi:hypothetical protein